AAPRWNRDAIGSPPVAPGKYEVVLHVGGHSYSRPATVMQDAHAPWTVSDATASRETVVDIVSRMSAVDDMLNALDALDAKLDARSKVAISNAKLSGMIAAVRRGASAVRAELTSSPTNDQDDDFLPDMLRERLQALYFQLSGSQYAPATAALRELDDLGRMQADASSRYRALMDGDVASLDAALKAAGYLPVH
ncbi:MAG TPA: hypothetical protein VEV38_09520, partial [Candidatus Eremiobacteraceae bacterium]|nr:hypothetical protein [Candidatus Eremiobacteraceae bacterium]